MQLDRLDGESKLQYHKRLVDGKLVDKTLADIDYSELAEYVYGQPYSSDVARRMMYGSKKTLELLEEELENEIESNGDHDILAELDAKKAELQRERQRFYDQRREYNKLVSMDGRTEHLYEALEKAALNLNETIGHLEFDDAAYYPHSDNEAVVVFSDWHYGMTAQNIFNKYNTDICKQRVERVVDNVIERIHIHQCNKVHVVILGDLFHGAIHVGARVASEELVADQMMQVSEILAQAIMRIAAETESVYVYMTYGNHARTVQNKSDSIHRDNLERIVGWWLRTRFQDATNIFVDAESDDEFLLFNVCDHWFCASHGDLDSVHTSPRLLATLFQKSCGADIEYILLGDKHHCESFNELGVTAMICGSLCGTDDYASDKRLYSLPSQLMLIVNKQCGVDAEYRIKGE